MRALLVPTVLGIGLTVLVVALIVGAGRATRPRAGDPVGLR